MGSGCPRVSLADPADLHERPDRIRSGFPHGHLAGQRRLDGTEGPSAGRWTAFSNEEGYAAFRERLEAARRSEPASTRCACSRGPSPAASSPPCEREGPRVRSALEAHRRHRVKYGVASEEAISRKKQSMLPMDCTVYDLLVFATEITSHTASSSSTADSCTAGSGRPSRPSSTSRGSLTRDGTVRGTPHAGVLPQLTAPAETGAGTGIPRKSGARRDSRTSGPVPPPPMRWAARAGSRRILTPATEMTMELQQRDYQDRVVSRVISFFEAGDRTVMIESPTGSGKTIMASASCSTLRRSEASASTGWRCGGTCCGR